MEYNDTYMCVDHAICVPESFNTNISHELFDYTITFLNSHRLNTNLKSTIVNKTGFNRPFERFLEYKKI